ncbi:hypothetical protein AcW1_009318 [Taiwanofungus camphoratus]|nr:hypothetical protein AcV7_003997 [Antrodia cinnamomea]KAI0947602.1 hypothetical protein AcW1_009318 [Antrodia cinnamomea]
MSHILLPLNDTAIVFLHPDDTHLPEPHVAQVTIKSNGPETVNTIAAFFNAQHDIGDLIIRIVTAHLHNPFPSSVVFEDNHYMLITNHAKWPFGKEKLKFWWGEHSVMACSEKWVFVFRPKVGGSK